MLMLPPRIAVLVSGSHYADASSADRCRAQWPPPKEAIPSRIHGRWQQRQQYLQLCPGLEVPEVQAVGASAEKAAATAPCEELAGVNFLRVALSTTGEELRVKQEHNK